MPRFAALTGLAVIVLTGTASAQTQHRERADAPSAHERARSTERARVKREEPASAAGVLSPLRLDAEAKTPRQRGWNDPLGGSTHRGRAGN
jgi:hypothetical protein